MAIYDGSYIDGYRVLPIGKPSTYRSNQFQNFSNYEPGSLTPNQYDNPPFLWPKDQYMDISGNTHTVQRGYMRSLITDPAYNPGSDTPNRRLFFQFNPTVLVRSVQQTVGSMNPLLQDPAQLIQPVPGTTTFGFELLFNREHEVASGYVNPNESQGAMSLPSGGLGLVSQIGVLADIMVLDTITGQGISQDMIGLLVNQARAQTEKVLTSAEQSLGDDSDNEEDDAARKQLEATRTSLESLGDAYSANVGNQAFLNPLPFRVLFSSMFMVEGVATNVDVQFQKFSRSMVPTQCKVTINMYALYFGFARKNTYLTSNLANAAADRLAEQEAAETQQAYLEVAVPKMTAQPTFRPYIDYADDAKNANTFTTGFVATLSDVFKQTLADKVVTDARVQISMNYKFTNTANTVVSSSSELDSVAIFCDMKSRGSAGGGVLPDITEIPLEDFQLSQKAYSVGGKTLTSDNFIQAMKQQKDAISPNLYLSYQLFVKIMAKSAGSNVSEVTLSFPIVNGVQWYDPTINDYMVAGEYQTWYNNKAGSEGTKSRGGDTR